MLIQKEKVQNAAAEQERGIVWFGSEAWCHLPSECGCSAFRWENLTVLQL